MSSESSVLDSVDLLQGTQFDVSDATPLTAAREADKTLLERASRDRRAHPRFLADDLWWLRGTRLKYGAPVDVIDLSIGGALFEVRAAINRYFADKGKYPYDLNALVEDKYLHKRPRDPITESDSTWIEIPAEVGEEDLSQEPGIADIKSGAPGVSIQGTPFGDW